MLFEHPTYPRCYPGPEKQKVRLICIPRFSESGVAVMVCTVIVLCMTTWDRGTYPLLYSCSFPCYNWFLSDIMILIDNKNICMLMQLNLRNLECSTLSFSTSFDAWICSDFGSSKTLAACTGAEAFMERPTSKGCVGCSTTVLYY
jgi:hypothetical protein